LQIGEAMESTSLRAFATLQNQMRWLTWLALWLIASYCLRHWASEPVRQLD